ncbi:MAG: archaellin/type IV pilin N-terminal domain-containing protein [Thermoplasmata archaeon]
MKKAWMKKDEGVSPVIATILMVAITVVLAAVLYVMVMNINPPDPGKIPMGVVKHGRTADSVSILIAKAPSNALVHGTQISLSRDGLPTQISNASVYDSAAALGAWYTPADGWNYGAGYERDTLKFEEGSVLIVWSDPIENGDIITISSSDNNFGITTFNVN